MTEIIKSLLVKILYRRPIGYPPTHHLTYFLLLLVTTVGACGGGGDTNSGGSNRNNSGSVGSSVSSNINSGSSAAGNNGEVNSEIILNQTSAILNLGQSQIFTASMPNDVESAGVTWSLSGVGALVSTSATSVEYLAPSGLPGATTVTLTATSKANASANVVATIQLLASTQPQSAWVYYDSKGKLQYKALTTQGAKWNADQTSYTPLATSYASGNTIMDFSTAGYNSGEGPLPSKKSMLNNLSPAKIVRIHPSGDPSGASDKSAIAAAISSFSSCETSPKLKSPCAMVLLEPGTFYVDGTININTSGIVLAGSGSGTMTVSDGTSTPLPGSADGYVATVSASASDTVVHLVTPPTGVRYPFVTIAGSYSRGKSGTSRSVANQYIPSGSRTLTLTAPAAPIFTVGDSIVISKRVNYAWIEFMTMTPLNLGGDSATLCSGGTCKWITDGDVASFYSVIAGINGNTLTLTTPLSDSIDSAYASVSVAPLDDKHISQVGVQDIQVIAPAPANDSFVAGEPTSQLVVASNVINSWIQDVVLQDTLNSVALNSQCQQMTVKNVSVAHTVTQTGSAKYLEFNIDGASQILFDGIRGVANFMVHFATGSLTQGPNVVRNAAFYGDQPLVEPHMRWATGLLIENTMVRTGKTGRYSVAPYSSTGYRFYNGGATGTGHGWDIGWGVIWNSTGPYFTIQRPPGSANWCVGCVGQQLTESTRLGNGRSREGVAPQPQGEIDSPQQFVFPLSLYQAQLTQRLGPGYIAQ